MSTPEYPGELQPAQPLYTAVGKQHLSMVRTVPKGEVGPWRCTNCDKVALMEDMGNDCTYEPPSCPSCGQTPICAWDCKGIWHALNAPDVHVAGGQG